MLYKMGDVVRVYSLQSFHGGGFIKGREGIVSQDQSKSGSVLVAVKRRGKGGRDFIDSSYEVYPQQLEFVCYAGQGIVKEFEDLIKKIKEDQEKDLFVGVKDDQDDDDDEYDEDNNLKNPVDDIPF